MPGYQQEVQIRLKQLLILVSKEDEHLQAVRQCFFKNLHELDIAWVKKLNAKPESIDQLESFAAKFSRMQDTIVDKLLPQLLKAAGEKPGSAIDNLNRAERLHLVENSDEWIAIRGLRNLLVHEYIESPEEMLTALQKAREFTDQMHKTYQAIANYAKNNLNLDI